MGPENRRTFMSAIARIKRSGFTGLAGGALLLAGLTASASAAIAPAEAAQRQAVATHVLFPGVLIGSDNSKKCLEVKNSSTANGALADQWDCNGNDNQLWGYNTDTTGLIENVNSQKCLEVRDSGTANGALVDQWDCNDNPNQTWWMGQSGLIENRYSKKCLEVANSSTTNGAQLDQWGCNGKPNQIWHWPG